MRFDRLVYAKKAGSIVYGRTVGVVAPGGASDGNGNYVQWPRRLDFIPHEYAEDVTRHLSSVYFLLADDVIMKIGQTSDKNGIRGCMSWYCNAGFDSTGMPRFTCSWLIRELLDQGKRVEVALQSQEPMTIQTNGLFSSEYASVQLSAKAMEALCLKQFHDAEGRYPEWNFQERRAEIPSHIYTAYGNYKVRRGEVRGD